MKPAPFEYLAPLELEETLELLQRYGEDAKVLAGGQSLMPLMNLRLARPKVIIDINRLSRLSSISAAANGGLVIGALTRQRAIERAAMVKERNPLLAATMPLIGHFQIRNRGTVGGSLAHADPAAELPAVSAVLGAEFVLQSARRERVVQAEDFFVDTMTTAIQPDELLTEIRLPGWRPGLGWAIDELSRRRGDFAMVGVAVLVQMDGSEACQDARVALFGVGGKPVRMPRAEGMLRGKALDQKTLLEIARSVSDELDPDSDVHASAEYRREVGGVLTRRALERAFMRTTEGKKI
ncbi:xanthine dehydrogenase family protein subunit M [bacterium]|nr:MAG: xanthine dehydrogenase family protein subunit M [bacterium]